METTTPRIARTPLRQRFTKLAAAGLIGLTALGGVAVLPSIADAQEVPGQTQEDREARQAARQERRAEKRAAIADAVGVSVDELQVARQAGQSLADIAAANGASVDSLIDTLVDMKTASIDAKVADGTITQAEADEKLAGLSERVTERVNAEPGERDGNRGRRGNNNQGAEPTGA